MAAPAGTFADRLGVMCQLGADEKRARTVLAAAARAGFQLIQVNFSWNQVDGSFMKGLPSWIRAEGLRCEILSAYVNCLRPDVVLMNTRREDFRRALEYAAEVGAHRLVAWTGSYLPDLMAPDERNLAAASEDAIVRFLEPSLPEIERLKLQLALETYITLACPDASSLRRMLDRLPKSVGAVLDPPNLTPPKRYRERDKVLREMVDTLQGRIVVVHMKDFRLAADGTYQLPGPLSGEMDYRLFLGQVMSLPTDVPAIAEHIEPGEFAETRRKLLAI
jgi:sugar phosphate isomerase/epimerase